MQNTFKAAVLINSGQALQLINNIIIPKATHGEVLVRIHYAGLCHSQLMEVQGLRGEDKYLPHMLGHEGVGTVVEVGEGVTKVKPNDEVIISWIKGNGLNTLGHQYRTLDEVIINAGAATTFSEYAIVSENRVVLRPDATPERLSVLFGCAVPTGFGMVIHNIPENAKGSIAFIGLGGIGLSALLAAKLYHFEQIFAIDVNEEKLILSKELGATHLIDASQHDVVQYVKSLTQGVGVDYAFESAGTTKTIEQAFNITRTHGGACIFASHPPYGEKIQLDPFDLICGKSIKGAGGGGCCQDKDIQMFDRLYAEGKLPLEYLVSKEYPLIDINNAIQDLKSKKIVRALINCA